MQRDWSTFYPDVLPSVIGCPEPTVDLHLRRAAQAFCVFTKAWRVNLPPITTRLNISDYPLVLPAQAEIVKVFGASLNGSNIDFEVADASTVADRASGSGCTRLLMRTLKALSIIPAQAAGLPIIINAALKPSEQAAGVDADIADLYAATIANGALATLLLENKAPWANPTLAGIKMQLYTTERNRVQGQVWKAYSQTQPRVRGQYF